MYARKPFAIGGISSHNALDATASEMIAFPLESWVVMKRWISGRPFGSMAGGGGDDMVVNLGRAEGPDQATGEIEIEVN